MTDRPEPGQLGVVQTVSQDPGAAQRPDLDELFTAHAPFVWRTLMHFGLDESAAEDATQDVFVVVHRRLGDLDPNRPVRSWLWGIARRVAATHQRGQRRVERKLAVVPAPHPEPAPDDTLEARQAVALVEQFLDALREDQRQVFVLAEIEGATAPEIADALGVKLNTVYSRLRAARSRFQRMVSRHQARQRGGRHD